MQSESTMESWYDRKFNMNHAELISINLFNKPFSLLKYETIQLYITNKIGTRARNTFFS